MVFGTVVTNTNIGIVEILQEKINEGNNILGWNERAFREQLARNTNPDIGPLLSEKIDSGYTGYTEPNIWVFTTSLDFWFNLSANPIIFVDESNYTMK